MFAFINNGIQQHVCTMTACTIIAKRHHVHEILKAGKLPLYVYRGHQMLIGSDNSTSKNLLSQALCMEFLRHEAPNGSRE